MNDDNNDNVQLTSLNSLKLTIGYVFYLLKPMVTDTWKLLQIPNFIFLTLPFSFMMSVMNIVLSSPHIIPKACLDNVTADLSFYMVPLLMGSGFLSSTIFTTLISLLPLEAPRVEGDEDISPQDHHYTTTNNDNTKGSNQHLTRNAGSINNNLRNDMSVQLLEDEDDVEEYNVDTTPTAAGSTPRMMFVDENNAQLVVIDPSTSNFSKFSRTLSSGHSNGSQLINMNDPSHQGDEGIDDLMLFNNQQNTHNNNNNNKNNATHTARMMPKGINTIIKISYIFSIFGFLIFFSQLQNTLTNTTIFIALGWIGVTALPILPVSMDSLLSLTYPEFDPQLTSSILLSCGQFPSMLFLPIAMKVLTLDDYAQCNTTNNFFNIFGHKVHYGLLFTKFGFILMALMTAMFVMVMNYTGVKQNKKKNKNPTKNHQQQRKEKKRWCGII